MSVIYEWSIYQKKHNSKKLGIQVKSGKVKAIDLKNAKSQACELVKSHFLEEGLLRYISLGAWTRSNYKSRIIYRNISIIGKVRYRLILVPINIGKG